MSLNAYIRAYQLKMVLNKKSSYSETEKYDTKNNCLFLKYYYFFD